MEARKMALLSQIIREYIKSASPVGSKLLEDKSKLGVSSATIRNEMASLEKEGYIVQPHTSAGRIPTEKGYKFFLENYLPKGKLAGKEQQELEDIIKRNNEENIECYIKLLAKKIADLSQNAVVIGSSDKNLYYTGLANLFSQPEFSCQDMVQDVSVIMDHLDTVMSEIFDEINDIIICIGSENPFGKSCSIVLSPWIINDKKSIIGILGPMRMDYERNIKLIGFINNNF